MSVTLEDTGSGGTFLSNFRHPVTALRGLVGDGPLYALLVLAGLAFLFLRLTTRSRSLAFVAPEPETNA